MTRPPARLRNWTAMALVMCLLWAGQLSASPLGHASLPTTDEKRVVQHTAEEPRTGLLMAAQLLADPTVTTWFARSRRALRGTDSRTLQQMRFAPSVSICQLGVAVSDPGCVGR